MANQVTTVLFTQAGNGGTIDPAIFDADPAMVFRLAQIPGTAALPYIFRMFDEPDIVSEGTVDNGLTPVATKLFSLTTVGVTFPATTVRRIRWTHLCQTDNDRFVTEYERYVLGGTTPVLLGSRRVVHSHGVINSVVWSYGSGVQLHGTTSGATVTNGADTAQGYAVGNFTSGAATITMPGMSRATPRAVAWHFAEDAGAVGDVRTMQIRALATDTATATLETYTTNGTEALSSPNGTNNYDAILNVLPPGDADLVMNSNAVECQITGVISDETRHRVEMKISRAVQVAFQGS